MAIRKVAALARPGRPIRSDANAVIEGGRNFYGIPLGIVILDTPLPRLPGDVGNASTWAFPVVYRVVPGAGVRRVIRELGSRELLEPFVAAAQDLDRAGVSVITTSCGYCALYQRELQESVRATVISSSLLQVRWLAGLLPPGARIGILTMEAASLTRDHLAAVGVTTDVPLAILGMDEAGPYTHSAYLEARTEIDVGRMRAELEGAANLLRERNPDLAAVVLECTNFPPYADVIAAVAGVPVYDLVTAVNWAVAAHRRQPFSGYM